MQTIMLGEVGEDQMSVSAVRLNKHDTCHGLPSNVGIRSHIRKQPSAKYL